MKEFPIHCTAPGPLCGKPAVVQNHDGEEKHYMTHNPIPEGARFETQYKGYTVVFRVDMNLYTDKDKTIVEVIKVTNGKKM